MKWNFSCIFFTLIVPYGYLLVTADTHYTSKFSSSNVNEYDQYDRSRSHLSHHHSQHLSSEQSSDDYSSSHNKRLFHVNNDLGSRSEPVWVQDHISIPLPEKTLDIESHSEDEEDEENGINHQEEYDDLDNNLPLIPNNQDESNNHNATSIGNGKDDRHKHQSATERDPYLIVTQKLVNLTTLSGKKIRLRCSFKSYPPARVRWLKNEAPLEVGNRRTKGKWSIRLIRSASTGKITSRLLINHLDVHDTGYYKCEAENGHLTAETSGVLMVLPVSMNSQTGNSESNPPNAILTSENFGPLHTTSDVSTNHILPSQPFQPVIGVSNSNSPKLNLSSFSTSILPISSPSNTPLSSGSCHLYTGRICSQFIGNRSVYIPQGADQFDLEHDLVTIAELIAKSPQISPQCHRYAISSICLFSFPLCVTLEQKSDPYGTLKPHRMSQFSEFSGTTQIRKICREECEILENNICHKEYSMARNIAVINRNLLPDCQKLPILGSPEDYECIQLGIPSSVRPLKGDQICFNDNGEKYRGIMDRTVSGKKCLPWSTVADTINHDELLGGHNYCRNPDSSEMKPWCIVSFETHQKELCDIPRCEHFHGSNHYYYLTPSIAIVSVSGLVLIVCCLRMFRSRRKSFSTETKIAIPSSASPFSAYSAYITPNDHDNQQQAHPTLISPLICNKKGYSPVHLASPASSVTGLWIEHPLLDNQLHTSTATLYQQFKQPHYHSHQQLQIASSKSNLNQYSRQSIKITGKLSESDFGDILSGELLIPLGVVVPVAIRTLRDDCSPNTIENFKNEAQTLAQLQHPNIVCLLGVCFTDKPMCMMFELMGEGDLLKFLHKHSPQSVSRKNRDRFVDRDNYHTSNESCDGDDDESNVLTSTVRSSTSSLDLHDLLHIGIQIAAGMEYLSSKHFTHRDLACRNCFVSNYLNVKISNFRLNHIDYSSDYYCIPNNSSIPVRWLPPESIFYERFTSASDTWSFGILLWEIFTFGKQPYSHSTNEEVIELIRNHNLLPCPENCPPAYYEIMLDCWKRDPSMRPDFSELHTKLKALQAVESIRSNKSTFHCINSHKSGKSSSPQPHYHRTPENGINLNGSGRDIGPMSSPRRTRRANAMMISCKDISSNDKIYSKLSCPFNNSTSSSLGFV